MAIAPRGDPEYLPVVRRTLLVALALLGGAGCLLFVETGSIGSTCTFEGSASACGACVAEKCQTKLDACCTDGDCKNLLPSLDHCARSAESAACADLQTNLTPTNRATLSSSEDPATGALANALRACVAASCSAVCAAPGGNTRTRCVGALNQTNCECGTRPPLNDVACNTRTVVNSVCCAGPGFPDRDLSCQCRGYGCTDTNDGCTCSGTYGGPKPTCTGTICCVDEGVNDCSCGTRACNSIETRVRSCAAEDLPCARPTVRVDSCAFVSAPRDGGAG